MFYWMTLSLEGNKKAVMFQMNMKNLVISLSLVEAFIMYLKLT